ncbi:MAG: fatty acid desaturase [Calothrix sp. MO_167.B12]|nr:fatty acid desaturase [Calothrix sp. MO_167.B12]
MGNLIPQSVYAKSLRSQLPKAAFEPDPSKLTLLVINLLILGLGWGMGSQLHHWPIQWLWLYLPFALIMGNSITVLAFASHDLMHGSVTRNYKLASRLALITQTILWMPPTLWQIVHNRIHHNKTNSADDPDRNYYLQQPHTIGKRVQALLFPSSELALPWLVIGVMTGWGIYTWRNILSVLIWNGSSSALAPATFTVSQKQKWAILRELAVMIVLHLCILACLSFNLLQIALAYVLPIVLGYAGMMLYIYTNHLVSPITEINDPLANGISLQVPKFIDVLHVHFSYHVEHHIFPGLNSDYYPMVRDLLRQHYSDRMGYVVGAVDTWKMLLSTPRHYLDAVTLTDWHGQYQASCHLICGMDETPRLDKMTGFESVELINGR